MEAVHKHSITGERTKNKLFQNKHKKRKLFVIEELETRRANLLSVHAVWEYRK